jgi:phosphatidate cytidylyltransferase
VNELAERVPRGPLLYVFAGILGLLAIATLLGAVLARAKPERDFTELNARIRSWWSMAGVFMLAILLSRAVSLVFLTFLSFLALKEYLSLIPTRRADRGALLWVYLAVPLQYLWVWVDWYGMFIIFIPVYMFILIPVRMVLHGQTEGFPVHRRGAVHLGQALRPAQGDAHRQPEQDLRGVARRHGHELRARLPPGATPHAAHPE